MSNANYTDTTTAPSPTTNAFEVIYGTSETDPTDGLATAFHDFVADAQIEHLELLDTSLISGSNDDQQVAVSFEILTDNETCFEHAESITSIAVESDESPSDDIDSADDENSDVTDIELAPEIQGATEAVITFHPQIWRNERAVTSDNTETYTLPIEDVVTDDGELPPDNSGVSDQLAWHDDAPSRARNWEGPFYVTIDEVR